MREDVWRNRAEIDGMKATKSDRPIPYNRGSQISSLKDFIAMTSIFSNRTIKIGEGTSMELDL